MSEASRTAPETANALPVGTRLGEFEVRGLLGVGGFGIVYLGFDHALEREVAIKEYMPASMAGRTETLHVSLHSRADAETFALGLKSFVNEAKLLARFEHPSLIKVYRFWEAHGTAYMAMPLLRGRSLRDLRRSTGRAPDEALLRDLLEPLLGALEVLHNAGVYHRDIAPDNVHIEPDGRPVLLDFGAARHVIADRTQTLTAILKPAYAPIEQYAEAGSVKQGAWTDLYSLGATLHYLLLGQPPAPATARTVFDESAGLTTMGLAGYSPEFLHVVEWMLAPRPLDRPQSVAQVRAALRGERAAPPPSARAGALEVPRAAAPPPLAAGPDLLLEPAAAAPARAGDPAFATTTQEFYAEPAGDRPLPPRARSLTLPLLGLIAAVAGAAAFVMWPRDGVPGPAAAASSPLAAASMNAAGAASAAPEVASAPAAAAGASAPTTTPALASNAASSPAFASGGSVGPGAEAGAAMPTASSPAHVAAGAGGSSTAHVAPPAVASSAASTATVPVAAAAASQAPGSAQGPATAPASAVRPARRPPPVTRPLLAGEGPALVAPEARCGGRNPLSYHVCMERECQRPRLVNHPDCQAWRRNAPPPRERAGTD